MRMLVAVRTADVLPGDEVACIEEGVLHTRVVYSVGEDGVLFAHGELLRGDVGLLVSRDIEVEAAPFDIEDDRPRPDLEQAYRARSRARHLPEDHPDYWDHYYGVAERAEATT